MLYSVDENQFIDHIPHRADYEAWRELLNDQEYGAITAEINRVLDANQVVTAGWVPGNNWTGTVYEPIYTKACDQNEDLSGLCFGLFFWVTVMQRQNDTWAFGRYNLNNIPIRSITYYRVQV